MLQMDFPTLPGSHRILNVHQNVPGVLKNVNNIIADLNVNIKAQVWPSPVARAVGMQHINSCEREEPQGRIPASVRSHSFHPCEAACWQAALRIGR